MFCGEETLFSYRRLHINTHTLQLNTNFRNSDITATGHQEGTIITHTKCCSVLHIVLGLFLSSWVSEMGNIRKNKDGRSVGLCLSHVHQIWRPVFYILGLSFYFTCSLIGIKLCSCSQKIQIKKIKAVQQNMHIIS